MLETIIRSRTYFSLMCGRFSIAVRIGYLCERFGVSEPPEISLPAFNIAPAEDVPVITANGFPHCSMMHWGLVQPWTHKRKPTVLVNVRAEGLSEKNQFQTHLSHGRCIVPATGFYEWEKTGSQKYPVYFRLKHSEVFAMAGLCGINRAPDDGWEWTFSIITTGPNSLVRPLHDRMPAILSQEDEKNWLNPDYGTAEDLVQMLHPFPSEKMKNYRVTKRANSLSYKSEDAVAEDIPEICDLSRWD